MGLFDMFGAGGGSLQIQPTAPHVAAGSAVAGNVIFMGGKRAQNVTNIKLRMTMEQRSMRMTNQGMQPHTDSRDVCPATVVVGAFQTQPGQPSSFPFQLMVPPGLPNSTPGQVTYHLRASADIDGEVDPGSSIEVQVVGGAPAGMGAPMGGMAPGMMPGGMAPGMGAPMGGMAPGMMPGGMAPAMGAAMGMAAGMMPGGMAPGMGAPMGGMAPGMGAPMGGMAPGMGAPMGGMAPGMGMPGGGMQIAPGTRVMAQWQDGQMHPATVQRFEPAQNVYYVDWTEPHLGASSYVYGNQIQVMAGAPGMHPGHHPQQQGMPMGKGMDHGKPGMHAPQQQGMPMGKGGAPMGGMPMGGAPVAVGMHCVAQHPQNGQWFPGKVVAMQQGMVGVDWDDPKLGQSTWVQMHAVRAK